MRSPISDDKKSSLTNLLKINLLPIKSDKLSRQKPQIKIFNNTDTFNKMTPINNDRGKPNLTTTSFYKPYHKINHNIMSNSSRKNKTLYTGKIPLEFLGKATLDFAKTFYTTSNEELKKNKKIYTKVKNKVFNPFDNEIMNINKKAEIKFTSEIKFAQNSSNWYKLKKYKSLISDLRRREFEDLFTRILKLLETQSRIIFSKEKKENGFLSPVHTMNNNDYKIKVDEEEENNISEKMKKIISLGLEIGISIKKFTNLIFNELREKIDENSKLLQRGNEYEMRCNLVTKELEKLQKFCESYDITSKMYLAKARENTINNIKNLFNKKENEYKISMYKMEDEIKDLTHLLNKNKDYFTKYKEKEAEVIASKRQRDEYKYLYNKEIQEKILQNANVKDKEEELNKKVNELEDYIDELKEEIEINKRKEIESNAKLSKMMMILSEKNENLHMFNEELEWYMREYNKKKNELKTLENRVFKNNTNTNINNRTDNKKRRTKREKIENKDDTNNSKIIEKNGDKKI